MTEKENILQYIRNWKVVGEELDRMKGEELRAMSEEESAARIHDVMLMADGWLKLNIPAPGECGLVEQQRIFHKCQKALT